MDQQADATEDVTPQTDGEPSTNEPLRSALCALLDAVQRHRLMFLYFADVELWRSPSPWEEVGRMKERIGWEAMVQDIDEDGEFLIRHRFTLDVFAQRVISRFGAGTGEDRSKRDTLWKVDEIGAVHLEESVDVVIGRAEELAKVDDKQVFGSLAKRAVRQLHDKDQTRWRTCDAVRWEYLPELEAVIEELKTAKVTAGAERTSMPTEPTQNGIIVRSIYDDDDWFVLDVAECESWGPVEIIEDADYIDMVRTISATLYRTPQRLFFLIQSRAHCEAAWTSSRDPTFRRFSDFEALEWILRNKMTPPEDLSEVGKQRLSDVMGSLDDETSESTKSSSLDEGEQANVTDMAVKLLRGLRFNWDFCRQLIRIQQGSMCGDQPHPLLRMIVHLRGLLDSCFKGLAGFEDADKAKEATDWLLDTLIGPEPDNLDCVLETTGYINDMEVFLVNTSILLGITDLSPTDEDRAVADAAQEQIDAFRVRHESKQKEFVDRIQELARKKQQHPAESHGDQSSDAAAYVTLADMSKLAVTPKKTLEDWKQKGKLPSPDVPHSGKRAAKWKWNTVRPALEKLTGMELPKCPPQESTN
ncbi:MAG: hypothetical protein IID44_14615 [Planctomycetes bacterium]|nr:hypothetical protein [Planctomycetota bacterium]